MSETNWPNYGSGIVWSCKHSPSGQCNHKACGDWGKDCVLKKAAPSPLPLSREGNVDGLESN